MHLHVGEDPFDLGKHAKVGNDDTVNACVLYLAEKLADGGELVSVGHGVEREIYLFSSLVGVLRRHKKLFKRKVVSRRAHSEAVERKICRIGSVVKRRLKLFKVACRREKLCPVIFQYLPRSLSC